MSIWICLAKGLVTNSLTSFFAALYSIPYYLSYIVFFTQGALGSEWEPILNILRSEPVLFWNDPAPYSIIQALLYLFYAVPVQFMFLYYILKQSLPPFLWEVTLAYAGALMQVKPKYIVYNE